MHCWQRKTRQIGTPLMDGLPAMAGKVEALLVWLTTSHRMRRCEHIVQQRRQPRLAKFWAWRPPSSVISRSDTAALLKVSRVLPTNLIVPVRLGAPPRPCDVRNADFSPMSRTQLLFAKPHARGGALGETASPRYALLLNELPTLPQRPSEKSVTSVCKNLCRVSR